MIGPFVTMAASRSLIRSLGAGTGPVGVVAGALLPLVLPRLARALGPWGMAAAALGVFVAARAVRRRKARAAAAALDGGRAPGEVIEGRVLERRPA